MNSGLPEGHEYLEDAEFVKWMQGQTSDLQIALAEIRMVGLMLAPAITALGLYRYDPDLWMRSNESVTAAIESAKIPGEGGEERADMLIALRASLLASHRILQTATSILASNADPSTDTPEGFQV